MVCHCNILDGEISEYDMERGTNLVWAVMVKRIARV